jgi:hypothetical protein
LAPSYSHQPLESASRSAQRRDQSHVERIVAKFCAGAGLYPIAEGPRPTASPDWRQFTLALPVACGVLAARTVTRVLLLARRAQVASKIELDASFGWMSNTAGLAMATLSGYLARLPAHW